MTPTQKMILKVVGGIAVVAVPAGFNYLAARIDSNEAKVRAEVAYETMVRQVAELQEAVHKLELAQASLQGQVVVLSRPVRTTGGSGLGAGAGAPKPADPEPPPAPAQLKAPPAFEDAVRDYKAKK